MMNPAPTSVKQTYLPHILILLIGVLLLLLMAKRRKRGRAAMMILLCIMVAGVLPQQAVYAAESIEVDIPYDQTWQIQNDGGSVDSEVSYNLIRGDTSSPMPQGSDEGVYSFTLTGNEHGDLNLTIPFSKPGYYNYRVIPQKTGSEGRYSYDSRTYNVMVMIINGSSGLEKGTVTIQDADRHKYPALEFRDSYIMETPERRTDRSNNDNAVSGTGIVNEVTVETEDIPETEDVPESVKPEETSEIDENSVPTEQGELDYWALLNLILMVITVITALADTCLYFKRPREDKENEEAGKVPDDEWKDRYLRRGLVRILTLIVAVISVILFFLTEDMSLPMKWLDEYTIWMLVLFIAASILAILSRKRQIDRDGEESGINEQQEHS